MTSNLPYRPCVGLMLLNASGQIFVGKRIDQTVEGWQMPQGGIDAGEVRDLKTLALILALRGRRPELFA